MFLLWFGWRRVGLASEKTDPAKASALPEALFDREALEFCSVDLEKRLPNIVHLHLFSSFRFSGIDNTDKTNYLHNIQVKMPTNRKVCKVTYRYHHHRTIAKDVGSHAKPPQWHFFLILSLLNPGNLFSNSHSNCLAADPFPRSCASFFFLEPRGDVTSCPHSTGHLHP